MPTRWSCNRPDQLGRPAGAGTALSQTEPEGRGGAREGAAVIEDLLAAVGRGRTGSGATLAPAPAGASEARDSADGKGILRKTARGGALAVRSGPTAASGRLNLQCHRNRTPCAGFPRVTWSYVAYGKSV